MTKAKAKADTKPGADALRDENTGEPMFDLAAMSPAEVIKAVKDGKLYRETALAFEYQQREKPRQEVIDALTPKPKEASDKPG